MNRELLRMAFVKINKSIDLSSRTWVGSFDAKENLIRAYIFSEFGKYDKAIIDVNRRLKVAPNDVSALKDKARYSAAANDLRTAYETLVLARKIQPDDLSIPLDIAYIFSMTGDSVYKQRTCELLNESKSDIKAKLDVARGALAIDLNGLLKRANTYLDLSKCLI